MLIVQQPTVAHQCPTFGRGDDFAPGRDSVLSGHSIVSREAKRAGSAPVHSEQACTNAVNLFKRVQSLLPGPSWVPQWCGLPAAFACYFTLPLLLLELPMQAELPVHEPLPSVA